MAYVPPTRGELQEIQAGARALAAYKTQTFSNATGSGKQGTVNLFKVNGACLVCLRGYCETSLAGTSATLVHGKAGTTNDLIPILTGTNIVAGSGIDSTSAVVARGTALAKTPLKTYFDGETIFATVATADLTAGKINYICDFIPLTPGAGVEAL